MKKMLGVLALALVIALPSCGSDPVNQLWLAGVDQGVEAIVPEYLEYVDADPDLAQDEKKIRHGTVARLREAIQKAKQKE